MGIWKKKRRSWDLISSIWPRIIYSPTHLQLNVGRFIFPFIESCHRRYFVFILMSIHLFSFLLASRYVFHRYWSSPRSISFVVKQRSTLKVQENFRVFDHRLLIRYFHFDEGENETRKISIPTLFCHYCHFYAVVLVIVRSTEIYE